VRIRLRDDELRKALARSGRSQNAWALALGLDSGHLSKLVNGQRRYPGELTRRKLLEGLGLEFEELFEVVGGPRRAISPPSRLRVEPVASKESALSLMNLTSVGNDMRYALRVMRLRPGFTALAVFIIALGVGASSAVFGIVDAVLLSPLPFPRPERLVLLWTTHEVRGGGGRVSFPDYRDWSEQSESFDAMAAFQGDSFILAGDAGSERVAGEIVSPEYFSLLGANALRGRTPSPDSGSEPAVVLSEGLVEARFGDGADILGRSVEVNGQRFTVIGVLPSAFRGLSGEAQLWVPMGAFDYLNPELVQYDILENRGTRWHSVLGRLGEGVDLAQAEAEMASIAAALSQDYPGSNDRRGVELRFAHDEIVSDHRASLVLLSAAVGVLMLLACVNLSNLFLLRVWSRRSEVSVRVALGANRARLLQQLLTETAAFALIGGTVGLGMAWLGSQFLVAFSPVALPSSSEVAFDFRVFAFALSLSVVAGIAFGLLPALSVSGARLGTSLQQAARSSFARRRSLAVFALSEIAIATLLLVGAGLVLKSFHKMELFEPGFDTSNLLTMRFHVPPDVAEADFLERIAVEVGAAPGVEATAVASHVYFGGGYMSGDLTVEGFEPKTPADEIMAYRHFVTDDYFRTMGIPLLRGEGFGTTDNVAIVNQSFAERMWPGDTALGKRLAPGTKKEDDEWLSVVGVVGDVKPGVRLSSAERLPQIYFPMREGGDWSRSLVVRSSTDPASVTPAVRAALRRLHPGIAVFSVATMDELLSRHRASLRYVAYLMGGFSLLALLLASIGLYGVVAYAVGQLTHEIGVRVAIGATRPHIIAMVMKPAAVIIGVGLTVGLVASFGATHFVQSLLYEVDPLDVGTFLAVAAGLTIVALIASYLPARKAACVDPVIALRHD
jgi:putative ABC transport system permease protein